MLDNANQFYNELPVYASDDAVALSLQDIFSILWDGKWLLIIVALLVLAFGGFYTWIATPIYKVDALVQIEEKSSGTSALFTDLGDLLDTTSPAVAEIEIIKSRLILGRVVQKLDLHIKVEPKTLPVIGEVLLRDQKAELDQKRPYLSSLELPDSLKNLPLTIEKKEKNRYILLQDEQPILGGTVDKTLEGTYAGDPCRIFVSRFDAGPGARFVLIEKSMLNAIKDLKENLSVEETGKQSGVLSLSYKDPDPVHATKILNEICTQYLMQNVERSSEEAEKTLVFLQDQLPRLKQKMERAEENLNAYRYKAGTVDLNQEATLMLNQSVSYEAKIFELDQKREDLLRLFKDSHPMVRAVESQIAQLKKEVENLETSVKKLPKTQQEVLRLNRDVMVNTELYTTLLNNAQQLQVAKAGEIGSVRIIDRAMPTSKPIKPRKVLMWALSLILGLFSGSSLVLLKRLWDKGVEDPARIEGRFGLPVYATVPHSMKQDGLYKQIRRKKSGQFVLAHIETADHAVESFRSLRTTLHFSMLDASNNVIMLAGPCSGIGKTFVSINFAATLALSGKKVLIVDADMRKGQIHQYFGLSRRDGLSDVLAGTKAVKEVIKEAGIENFWLMSMGQLPPNPSELLLQQRFSDCLKTLEKDYDYIVVDAPPILAVTDAVIIGKQAGTTLLLLKHRYHPMGEIESSIKRLKHAGINLKGVVFNDVVISKSRYGGRYGYKYGRYVYQYGYSKGEKG